jgi:hypothetical protein
MPKSHDYRELGDHLIVGQEGKEVLQELPFFMIPHEKIWEVRYVHIAPSYDQSLLDTAVNASHFLANQVKEFWSDNGYLPKSISALGKDFAEDWKALKSHRYISFRTGKFKGQTAIITMLGKRVYFRYPLRVNPAALYTVPLR